MPHAHLTADIPFSFLFFSFILSVFDLALYASIDIAIFFYRSPMKMFRHELCISFLHFVLLFLRFRMKFSCILSATSSSKTHTHHGCLAHYSWELHFFHSLSSRALTRMCERAFYFHFIHFIAACRQWTSSVASLGSFPPSLPVRCYYFNRSGATWGASVCASAHAFILAVAFFVFASAHPLHLIAGLRLNHKNGASQRKRPRRKRRIKSDDRKNSIEFIRKQTHNCCQEWKSEWTHCELVFA